MSFEDLVRKHHEIGYIQPHIRTWWQHHEGVVLDHIFGDQALHTVGSSEIVEVTGVEND